MAEIEENAKEVLTTAAHLAYCQDRHGEVSESMNRRLADQIEAAQKVNVEQHDILIGQYKDLAAKLDSYGVTQEEIKRFLDTFGDLVKAADGLAATRRLMSKLPIRRSKRVVMVVMILVLSWLSGTLHWLQDFILSIKT